MLRIPPFLRIPPLVCPGSETRGGFLKRSAKKSDFEKIFRVICSKMIGNPLEISFKTLEITVFLLYSKGRIQKKIRLRRAFPTQEPTLSYQTPTCGNKE